jgi:hypothetical protein
MEGTKQVSALQVPAGHDVRVFAGTQQAVFLDKKTIVSCALRLEGSLP